MSLTLTSSDKKNYQISIEAAKLSELLETCIDYCNNETEESIPLPNVNSKILEKIIEFCEHYVKEPFDFNKINKPVEINTIDKFPIWYKNYIDNIDVKEEIVDIIVASEYMIVMQLLELCKLKFAIELRGKTIEEIKERFDINTNFSQEEIDAFKINC